MSDATPDELMAIAASRRISDGDLVFVGVGTSGRAFQLAVGIPLVAARLAQLTHAPDACIHWSNILDPDLRRMPGGLRQSVMTEWPAAAALATTDLKVDMLTRGLFDVSFSSGAQIDRYGNLNITRLRRDDDSEVRLIGTLAQPEHLAFVRRPLIVMDLRSRNFVARVDTRTSFGFGDGGDHRRRLGLTTPGPDRVVTDQAVFGFEPKQHAMRILEAFPGADLDAIQAAVPFDIAIDGAREFEAPDPALLRLIRDEIDPSRTMLGAPRKDDER